MKTTSCKLSVINYHGVLTEGTDQHKFQQQFYGKYGVIIVKIEKGHMKNLIFALLHLLRIIS